MMITKLSDVQYFQLGNKKLPRTTAIFNLPALTTCPGKTTICSKICYALKAQKMYKNSWKYRQRCLQLTLHKNFRVIASSELSFLEYRGKIDTVRVHESGDFYNQRYLEDWFEIALRVSGLKFFAYTKSFHMDFSKAPSNFILFYSVDDSTKYKAPKGIRNIARTESYRKPNGTEKGKLCWDFNKKTNGSCKSCDYCFKNGRGKRKVTFFKH